MKKQFLHHFDTHRYIFTSDVSREEHKKHLGRFPSLLYVISSGLLIGVFCLLLSTSIGFAFHLPITQWHLPISILLAVLFTYHYSKNILNHSKSKFILVCLCAALVMFVSTKMSGRFFDLSYDGQAYHQEAVIALSNGWNPFYERLTESTNPDISYQKLLNSYPKGSEIIGSVIYKATGRIELGKSLNFVLFLTSFLLVLSLLLRCHLNPLLSVMAALILNLNPIFIVQSLSFYLDAQIYLLTLCMLTLLATLYLTHKNYVVPVLAVCLASLWSLKLTAIFTSSIILVGFLVFVWYSEKILVFFKTIQAAIIAGCIAIFLLGFNPYVTNTLWFGNPFYPTLGKNSSSYVTTNMPENLVEKNSIQRLIISVFSKTSGVRGVGKYSEVKTPFTYTDVEVGRFDNTNNTVGGFGLLFSGIFIFSIIGWILLIIEHKRLKWSDKGVLFLSFIVLVSSALSPVSSYARFVPQLWIFPCVISIYLIYKAKPLFIAIGISLIGMMVFNNFLISKTYYSYNLAGTNKINAELSEIKSISHNQKISVDFDVFPSNRVRFLESGVVFSEKESDGCAATNMRVLSSYIPESKITICFDGKQNQ